MSEKTQSERNQHNRHQPYRPLVYICSRYSGDIENNVKKAEAFSRYAYENGQIPITPHLLFPRFMKDSGQEREDAFFFNTVLMGKCAEMWVLVTDKGLSEGMQKEITRAERRKQIIRYFLPVGDSFREMSISKEALTSYVC